MPGFTRRTVLQSGAATALTGWLAAPDLAGEAPAAAADTPGDLPDEDGYELWLRYRPIERTATWRAYWRVVGSVHAEEGGAVLASAVAELERGTERMLGTDPPPGRTGEVHLGTYAGSSTVRATFARAELAELGAEGYAIRSRRGSKRAWSSARCRNVARCTGPFTCSG